MGDQNLTDVLAQYRSVKNQPDHSRVCRIGQVEIPTYILTLPTDVTRHRKLRPVWEPIIGRPLEDVLFYGVNGRREWGQIRNPREWDEAKLTELVQAGVTLRGAGPKPGQLKCAEIGVALGLMQVMQDALQHNHSHILFMENDANLLVTNQFDVVIDENQTAAQFIARFQHVWDNLPPAWDLVRLGACHETSATPVVFARQCPVSITRPSFGLCCHGMLLSARACRTLLDNAFPIITTIDHQLQLCSRAHNLNTFGVAPHFLGQNLFTNMGESTIGYTSMEQVGISLTRVLKLSPEVFMQFILFVKRLIRTFDVLLVRYGAHAVAVLLMGLAMHLAWCAV